MYRHLTILNHAHVLRYSIANLYTCVYIYMYTILQYISYLM